MCNMMLQIPSEDFHYLSVEILAAAINVENLHQQSFPLVGIVGGRDVKEGYGCVSWNFQTNQCA